MAVADGRAADVASVAGPGPDAGASGADDEHGVWHEDPADSILDEELFQGPPRPLLAAAGLHAGRIAGMVELEVVLDPDAADEDLEGDLFVDEGF